MESVLHLWKVDHGPAVIETKVGFCAKYSLEMIFLNFSLNLKNSKGIYVLVNKKSKNQHVMKYKTLECPFW